MDEKLTKKQYKGLIHLKNHIVFFSGGKSSLSTADWVKTNHPDDNIVLYFTDTRWEDNDLYRLIDEASDKLQLPMLIHANGLNPIELMFEKKLVFNSMIGDCSKILKIKVSNDYLNRGIKPPIEKWRNKQFLKNENFVEGATLYYGIGFDEMHRAPKIEKNWKKFKVKFPLIDHVIDNDEVLKKYNIKQPRLYDYGFSHNNCMGRCVKAGQGHYKRLKEQMPDVYQDILEKEFHLSYYVSAYRYIIDTDLPEEDIFPEHVQEQLIEELENAYRDYFYGKEKKPKIYIHPAHTAIQKYNHIRKYSFMKKTIDGKVMPIRLSDFDNMLQEEAKKDRKRTKYEQLDLFDNCSIDELDIGGCGCFVDFS